MKKKIDVRLKWEATKTCGMFMAIQYYQLNVQFPYEFWTYSLLTEKFMMDIILYNEKLKQLKNQTYFVKEKKQ